MQHLPTNTLLQGGKYKIERVLGQGGFGITYLANQVMLDRKVCIKEFFFKDYCNRTAAGEVTAGTTGSKEIVERFLKKFLKEARTISKLSHPNIIVILDIFQENGTAYYVMQYIEGYSLADKVSQQGALRESEAVEYVKQIGSALEYIHQRRINHLDVKPANIMIRRCDNKAILIDFGVSKQYDVQGGQTSTTPVGISHGYAPMEQYMADGVSTFSPQTDIYALGATLYNLLTASLPPAPHQILTNGISIPSHISSPLANAIRQAMEQNRSKRPGSISAFVSLLRINASMAIHAHEKVNEPCDTTRILQTQNVNKQKSKDELIEEALRMWDESDKGRKYHIYKKWENLLCTLMFISVGMFLIPIIIGTFIDVGSLENAFIFSTIAGLVIFITLVIIALRFEKFFQERSDVANGRYAPENP